MSDTARIGLLGHGTVGCAFAKLVSERADEIARSCRPAAGNHRGAAAL